MYTLYIFDQSRSVTAIPSAGFLGAWNGYVFGMYSSQPYTALPCMSPYLMDCSCVFLVDDANGSEYVCYL